MGSFQDNFDGFIPNDENCTWFLDPPYQESYQEETTEKFKQHGYYKPAKMVFKDLIE